MPSVCHAEIGQLCFVAGIFLLLVILCFCFGRYLIISLVNFIIQCLYSQIEQYAAECIHFNKLSLYMCLLDRFCSCNYLCVVRLFAESILRYGLSPSFLLFLNNIWEEIN
eukprot:XP_025980690.1 uncharacterized protein LOC112998747 isoform X2 [Glycine max]